MRGFRAAVQFMTVLPAGRAAEFDPVRMAAWFPAVGLMLGGIVALIDYPARALLGPAAAAAVDVVALALLTGAFHLDGLGDTADGLFSHRPRERVLAIMKDSRIGAMGVVAILSVMLLKWAGIAALGENRAAVLALAPAYGRSAVLAAMRFLPYARPEGGTGGAFFAVRIGWRAFWGLAVAAAASLALGRQGLAVNAAFLAAAAGMIAFYRARLGGVTGDMLGALVETLEAALFLAAAAAGGAP